MFILSCIGMILTASCTVYISARISNSQTKTINLVQPSDGQEPQQINSLEIMILPISSSIFLILFFFYFQYFQYIFITLITCGADMTLYQIISLTPAYLCINTRLSSTTTHTISLLVTTIVTIGWLILPPSQGFILHDILGQFIWSTFFHHFFIALKKYQFDCSHEFFTFSI